MSSKIEWTGETWNPIVGCTKVSPGCKYCYAMKDHDKRHRAYQEGKLHHCPQFAKPFSEIQFIEKRLWVPLKRRKPTSFFINSVSDLFHEDIPDPHIEQVLNVARQTPRHTYQVLTKRAERLPVFFAARSVPNNVWLGVSVEDQRYGLPRIEHLRHVNAKTRFLSIEPLLEDLGEIDLTGIHWVIVGGESGPNARPMQKEWVLSIKAQCEKAGISFFFKQWGGKNKKKAGRILDGQIWGQTPETSQTAVAA